MQYTLTTKLQIQRDIACVVLILKGNTINFETIKKKKIIFWQIEKLTLLYHLEMPKGSILLSSGFNQIMFCFLLSQWSDTHIQFVECTVTNAFGLIRRWFIQTWMNLFNSLEKIHSKYSTKLMDGINITQNFMQTLTLHR